jgi:hypothetical protein
VSYSLNKIPNDPAEIPSPPLYAVWIEELSYRHAGGRSVTYSYVPPLGQIRHVPTLAKAKARVRSYTKSWDRDGGQLDEFRVSWAIYEWKNGQYELIFDGLQGEVIKENELFKKTIRTAKPKQALEYEVDAAVASILRASA